MQRPKLNRKVTRKGAVAPVLHLNEPGAEIQRLVVVGDE